MPRVTHVKSARKSPGTCSCCGDKIAAGQPYRWWKFRRSGKYIRCGKMPCAPKPADLTQSEFWKAVYAIQEIDFSDAESFESDKDDAVNQLQELLDETQGKFDNMPQGLQDGDTGQLLQERVDAVQQAIDALEMVDLCVEEGAEDGGDARKEEISEELQSALSDISCS